MLAPLSAGDRNGAMNAAREYVKNDLIGIQEEDVVPAKSQKVLDAIAENLLAVTEEQTYPMLVEAIQAFSKTGFMKSFGNQAEGVGHFVGDIVSSPFSGEARGRLSQGYSAISTVVREGKGDDLAMGLINFAKAACNISLDHVQALDLLETIGGKLAIDAIMIAATGGASAWAKAAQEGGKMSKRMAGAMKVGTTTYEMTDIASKPHNYATHLALTLTDLNAKIAGKTV